MDASHAAAADAAERAGDVLGALALYEGAVAADATDIGAWTRLGVLLASHARAPEAVRAFAAVVALRPSSAAALYNLGRAQATAGDIAAAESAFSLAADAAPRHVEVYLAWAQTLERVGREESAIEVYDRAVRAGCEEGALLMCHGLALHRAGRHREAARILARAAEVRSELAAEAHYNRGVCLAAAGDHAAAVEAYSASLAFDAAEPRTRVNRGISLVELGMPERALEDYHAALALDPELRAGLRAAGIACLLLGRWDESLRHLQSALQLDPSDAEAWAALGDHHKARQQFGPAVECYRRASEALEARSAPAAKRAELLNLRLDALVALSDFDAAHACARELRALDPSFPYAAGLEFFATAWTARWTRLEALREEVVRGAAQGEPVALPWLLCSCTDDAAIQRRAADAFIDRHYREVAQLPPVPPRSAGRLRLGYLSPDFRDHPVGQLIAATLERHDRQCFEVHGFATSVVPSRGALRARIEAGCDHFEDVGLLTDAAVAARIRDAGIDILIDLAGHTTGGRPGIVARRPAPIQVSFLGYPSTYGGNLLDYLIADHHIVPPSLERHYAERIARLPHSAVPPGDGRPTSTAPPQRAALGLPPTALVLAALHNTYKIQPEMYAAWLRLLEHHPRAVLWISRHDRAGERGLRRAAEAAGLDPSRLVFAERVADRDEYLTRLGAADLFLDAYPYNAHSSAVDALWAGVPVITRSGDSYASRVCGGLLQALGLDALVTESLDAYERTASSLLESPARLSEIKRWLTTRGRESAVFDATRHTRELEAAYTRMQARLLHGEAERSFSTTEPPGPAS